MSLGASSVYYIHVQVVMLVKYQYNGILKIIFGIYTHCEAHSNSMVELHVGVGLLEIQGDGFDSLPEALELHFLQLVPVGS